MVDGDTLSYHGNSGEVGCYVAPRPLSKDNNYFEVSIVDRGVRGTIAVGLVPQYYSLDHQPGWLPDSVAYHADDGNCLRFEVCLRTQRRVQYTTMGWDIPGAEDAGEAGLP